MKKIKIAYIGGGSTGWAWKFMSDLCIESDICGDVVLYDIDQQAAQRNARIGEQFNALPNAQSKWHYQTADSLLNALIDADFIIISITPASLDKEMRSDVHHPEQYNIFQSVGDTAGPGGYFRAMRTIPMYIEIGNAIKKYAPNAWVINYTNPMSLCVKTLYKVFPEIKSFGCCHEVFGTQELLAQAVAEKYDIELPNREEIHVNVQGINHFTWLDKAFYKDQDIFPIYREFIEKHSKGLAISKGREEGFYFVSKELVKFDLFKRYGLIAAAGDRHLAEFFPNSYFMKNEQFAESWGFKLTPVQYRVDRRIERMDEGDEMASGQRAIEMAPSGEEGVQQIRALLGLRSLVTNVNMPNRGQVSWAPLGAVVETNAVFRGDGVTPVFCDDLKNDVKQMIMRHILTQESFIDAYFNQDKQGVFNAWISDTMVNASGLTWVELTQLFDEMIENTKNYLPDFLVK